MLLLPARGDTHLVDDDFDDPVSGHHWAGTYRAQHLTELPTGTAEDIRLHAEEGVQVELLLTTAGPCRRGRRSLARAAYGA